MEGIHEELTRFFVVAGASLLVVMSVYLERR